MGRTSGCFSSLEAGTAPSDAVRASPQGGGSRSVPTQFLQVLGLKCLVSLAIRSYVQVLEGNQEQ